MAYNVTLIPGDGVGPEVAEATRRVLEASGVKFHWDLAYAGDTAQDMYGTPLPEHVLDSIRRNRVALKGPITTPLGSGFRSINVAIRTALDLYACLRPCKTYPGARTRYQNVDLVVVRENTEDLYSGIEFERGTPEMARLASFIAESSRGRLREDSSVSIKTISESGSRRIIKFAFDYARAHGRRKVTAVHKANIMKYTDGLFLWVANDEARAYPDIQFETVIVDTLCMQLVRRPEQYDVLVLPNLYGDIVSELCAGLIGGLGLAPSANLNEDMAVFEPTHGSAPRYAGRNVANPMAMMFSGVMMLRHLGEGEAADRLEKALGAIIAEGKYVTYDMKTNRADPTAVGTSQVADAVIDRLEGGGLI